MFQRDDFAQHYKDVASNASATDKFNGLDEHVKTEIKSSRGDFNKLVAEFREFKECAKSGLWRLWMQKWPRSFQKHALGSVMRQWQRLSSSGSSIETGQKTWISKLRI